MITSTQRSRRITGTTAAALTGLVLLAGCTGTGGGTDDQEGSADIPATNLQLATYLGPQTPYGGAIEWFVQEVSDRSEGAIEVEVFWEGALLTGPDVLTGVAQGRADLGFSTPNYSPAELPLTQIMSVPFLSSDVVAVQSAFGELYESNDDYAKEWSNLGVRPLAFQAVTPMVILGETAPADFEWIDGKSLRATSLMGNAVQEAGGNAVALPLPEVYESAQRGLIQGAASLNFGTIPSVSLEEVMPHVADPGTGIYSLTTLFANEDVFSQLDESVRAVVEEVAGEFNDVYLEQLSIFDAETCDVVLDAGGSVSRWGEDETAKWEDRLGDSILAEWKASATASGADLDAFYTQYLDLIDMPSESDYTDGVAACAERK